jgi:exodeoxyribonuclease V beta subunit
MGLCAMTGKAKRVEPLDVFTCELDGVSNIEASAGTGKTWAICGLYLRLIVEAGLAVDQVLVVTFTNAATAELRDRIRGRLGEALRLLETGRSPSADPFAEGFLRRIDRLGGETAGQAGHRLKAALLSFEEAAIFTIHSFCQRSLGEVPFSASQPFRVEVEADDLDVIRETAADCWRRIIDRYSAEEVRGLIEQKMGPEWLEREFRQVLGRPTARLRFRDPAPEADRASRRAEWLRRILLRTGPPAVRAAKRRRRVISYQDMLYNLYEALSGGRFPWLADRMRSRFPAALIDEFQDTDPLQFAIFRSIYKEAGTLFLVGDPKQAIYAFRNADLNTYLAAKRHAGRQWTLLENQRSEPGLISAVNSLFGANPNVFCSPEIPYREVRRGAKPIEPFSGDGEPRAPLSVWLFPPGAKSSPLAAGDACQLVLRATAGEMSRLLAGGMEGRIRIGERPLQPRDIAVLVRTRAQGRAVKAALARCGIGSVDLTERSVFAAAEAGEMERVLRAVAEPARAGLIRAALSTALMGRGSRELADLNADEEGFASICERMEGYRQRWLKHGFGAMWRSLLLEERVVERLLPQPGGERTITNVMHLTELMGAMEEQHPGIESLLRRLGEKRSDPQEEEVAQLRLESDENLVQIVTKHRAKGLEWPIVFCPFVWNERGRAANTGSVSAYHEGDALVLDYSGGEEGKTRQEEEGKAERVRLIYVALTRAIHRCYIAAGPFWQPVGRYATDKKARKGLLNWIAAGRGDSPLAWAEDRDATVEAIHETWRKLLASGQGFGEIPWLAGEPVPLPEAAAGKGFKAREVGRLPGVAWRLSSYSALSGSAREGGGYREPEARDYDATAGGGEGRGPEEAAHGGEHRAAVDILDFPAGTTAGRCLHAVFERVDFRDELGWDGAIRSVLASYPPDRTGGTEGGHAAMIRRMLKNVFAAPLPGGFSLCDVKPEKRISELEFAYPVGRLDPGKLNAFLERHGRRVPRLAFPAVEGYLLGFADLVFEHGGRWYVLDWKSNRLGTREEDYSRGRLDEEMSRHAYELQGLIYLTALHRYLRSRLPGYDCGTHIGGILYLFVRGVRPEWPSAGIWHDRPAPALIESLDGLFGRPSAEAGRRPS